MKPEFLPSPVFRSPRFDSLGNKIAGKRPGKVHEFTPALAVDYLWRIGWKIHSDRCIPQWQPLIQVSTFYTRLISCRSRSIMFAGKVIRGCLFFPRSSSSFPFPEGNTIDGTSVFPTTRRPRFESVRIRLLPFVYSHRQCLRIPALNSMTNYNPIVTGC